MKYLCDKCGRLVRVGEFGIHDRSLFLICPECKAASSVAAAAPQPSAPSSSLSSPQSEAISSSRSRSVREGKREAHVGSWSPLGSKPELESEPESSLIEEPGSPMPTELLCPKCGLPYPPQRESCARCGLVFARFNPENLALPGKLEAAWAKLEANWNDLAGHELLLDVCTVNGSLAEISRRYRTRAQKDPGDAIAVRYRDASLARLMAVAPKFPPRSGSSFPNRWIMLGIALFIIMVMGVMMALLYSKRTTIEEKVLKGVYSNSI